MIMSTERSLDKLKPESSEKYRLNCKTLLHIDHLAQCWEWEGISENIVPVHWLEIIRLG